MKTKGIFAHRSALSQLFMLLSFVLLGAVVSTMISSLLLFSFHGLTVDFNLAQHPEVLRVSQLISAIWSFLLPSFALAWFCSDNISDYLSLKRLSNREVWLITFLSILLISPSITLVGALNGAMTLPDFMAPIEEWMRSREDMAEKFTQIILSGNGFATLLANLVVVAAAAGLTEEFLFRGALQRVIGKVTTNPHTAIWLTAILFSAFHLQFYGFVPRMLLGAYLGYLLYWSKSIWLPVFAHFTNNSIAVIGNYSSWKDREFISGEIQPDHYLTFGLVAIITLGVFIAINQHLKRIL